MTPAKSPPPTVEQRLATANAALHECLSAAQSANPKDSARSLYERCNLIFGVAARGFVESGGTLNAEQADKLLNLHGETA